MGKIKDFERKCKRKNFLHLINTPYGEFCPLINFSTLFLRGVRVKPD
jgi:hypothetical protein